MKILKCDTENGEMKVVPENLEDLWYLSLLISAGDKVEGKSFRRFKTAGEGDRADSGEKKPVRLEISVSAVEFAEASNKLRVTGKINWGEPAELVQVASFHTIDIEEGHPVTIRKNIGEYEREILTEAKKSSHAAKVAVLAIDDRKASYSKITSSGIRHVTEIDSGATKRDPSGFENSKKEFFGECFQLLRNTEAETIIIAGPGYAKDELAKYLKEKDPKLFARVRLEHASTAERNAPSELMKRGALERISLDARVATEFDLLERLKKSVAVSDGLACYGPKEVKEASEKSAISELLVLDKLARKDEETSKIMRHTRQSGARITIFNSEDEAGAEFSTYGIAAILRFKLHYP